MIARIILALGLAVAVSAAADWSALTTEPVRELLKPIVDEVNAAGTTWTAGHNEYFDGLSVEQTRRLMGVVIDHSRQLPVRQAFADAVVNGRSKEVDLRTRGFGARNSTCVGPVLDQAECGSCWAFGAAEAISDRLCMKTGSFLQLAPLDLVSCDQNDGGCQGGDPASAWTYAQSGLATEQCMPYLQANGGPIPTCPPATEPCLNFVDTPNCPSTCASGSAIQRTHAVGSVYNVNGVSQIETEIDQNGSVEAAFTVYSDFLTYKSGVYTYQSGDELGGHAVKVIGYGVEGGVDYWLAQNSWTTTWGDGGYFKIRKGTDECGFEDDIVAGTIASAPHKRR
jgi:cathepsin B